MAFKGPKKRSLYGGCCIGILPGQYYDQETGLHYNYHRYYDPKVGRYLSPDPIGLSGGINLFVYAVNNPIIASDPEGLVVLADDAVIALTALTILTVAYVQSPAGQQAIDQIANDIEGFLDAILIEGVIGNWVYDITHPKENVDCDNGDDDFCYKRWEKEDSACSQWSNLGSRVVRACRTRAADRRNLCVANGGKPNPAEPPEYNPFVDYPR